jgi:hypothetical protein
MIDVTHRLSLRITRHMLFLIVVLWLKWIGYLMTMYQQRGSFNLELDECLTIKPEAYMTN